MKAVRENKNTACAIEERSYALVDEILVELEVQTSDYAFFLRKKGRRRLILCQG